MNVEKLVNSQIDNLSVDEILIFPHYRELAQEAKEAVAVFEKIAKFPARVDRVEIWQDRDGYNREYVTHDGMWQARYLHQQYDVLCEQESLFKLLKAAFLYELYCNEHHSEPSDELNYLRNACEVVGYFRAFINRTRRQLQDLD